jgi:hypothetical protein
MHGTGLPTYMGHVLHIYVYICIGANGMENGTVFIRSSLRVLHLSPADSLLRWTQYSLR